jgi:hypothetical protein
MSVHVKHPYWKAIKDMCEKITWTSTSYVASGFKLSSHWVSWENTWQLRYSTADSRAEFVQDIHCDHIQLSTRKAEIYI